MSNLFTRNRKERTHTREINASAQARQAWGSEYTKPDVAYEFSSGRKFDSTDKRDTGIYDGS